MALRLHISRRALIGSALTFFLASCLRDDDPPKRATATPTPSPTPSPTIAGPTSTSTTEQDAPTATSTTAPSPTPDEGEPAYRSPLTGEVLEQPPVRPFAVQIDNAPAARPQSGIVAADLVYEAPTEAGITRFTAFYASRHPAEIGPVRSVRLIALNVIPTHDGILVYSGGSIDMIEALFKSNIPALHAEGNARSASWRDPARDAPHNLYVSWPKLAEAAEELGFAGVTQAHSLTFGDLPAGGGVGQSIQLPFEPDQVVWRYDAGRGVYQRFVNDAPHVDREHPELQIEAANLIVIAATFVWKDFVADSAGEETLGVILTGTGDAMLLRDGQYFVSRWRRADATSPLQVVDPDSDEELPLKPGMTWLSIVPDTLDGVQLLAES